MSGYLQAAAQITALQETLWTAYVRDVAEVSVRLHNDCVEHGVVTTLKLFGLWNAELVEISDYPRRQSFGKFPTGPADVIELHA